MMQLGAEIIDGDADTDLVVNKMARTLKQGTTWTRNRDGKVSLLGHTFTCKEDLLTIMREFCIQEGFTLQNVKNEKTTYTKKCTDLECIWKIHCSVLIDKTTRMVKSHSGRHIYGRLDQNS